MKTTNLILTPGLALLLFLLPACRHTSSGHIDKESPNVIFILADDQGWNSLSIPMDPDVKGSGSDYYQTPNIDRLAIEGMRFSQGYSPAPLCLPARTSILFGISPAKTHVTSNMRPNLREYAQYCDADKSISALVKQADSNYVTGHFGKWHAPVPISTYNFDNTGVTGGNRKGNDSENRSDPKRTFEITEESVQFIEQAAQKQKPFYLEVAYYADHLDFKSSPEMLAKYENLPLGERHHDPVFAGMNEDMDRGVGMILNKLDQLGIADNTYIFYTADNGYDEGPSERHIEGEPRRKAWPLSYSKGYVMEGGVRVPFIVRGPGIKAGTVSRVPVIAYDLLPTFLNIINPEFELPDDKEGGTLLPVLRYKGKGNIVRKNDFLITHSPDCVWPGQSTLIKDDYKIVVSWAMDSCALFNLRDDISEQHDLSTMYPGKVSKLRQLMDDYLSSVGAPVTPEARKDLDLQGVFMKKRCCVYPPPKKPNK